VAASICGAVDALTRALAVELAPIRVNAVSPGVVRTALWDNMAESDREALYREVGNALPVGRVGEAADIAEAYLYLMRCVGCRRSTASGGLRGSVRRGWPRRGAAHTVKRWPRGRR
jgi:NAD(P)-dependent dehydrogenase (short-subunit alcohol dehydrogenase family)